MSHQRYSQNFVVVYQGFYRLASMSDSGTTAGNPAANHKHKRSLLDPDEENLEMSGRGARKRTRTTKGKVADQEKEIADKEMGNTIGNQETVGEGIKSEVMLDVDSDCYEDSDNEE